MSKIDDYTDVPHRKKKEQTSKSSRRSDHKHRYEKIILQSFIGWSWGKRCTVCGRIEDDAKFFHSKEFIKPECVNKRGLSRDMFYGAEELKKKYSDIPIYVTGDRISGGLWEYVLFEERKEKQK